VPVCAPGVVLLGCEPSKPQPVKTVNIPDGEIDPAVWGKAYPEEYELWKKTADPVPTRRSKYKIGMDGGSVSVDKLSMYPYMALLFNGWGFVWSTTSLADMPTWCATRSRSTPRASGPAASA